ncbi:MAG TPA: hypothetical protein VF595_00965 [Tepidisphaeraceae bacterium]|jgi:ElaB/YqjD/DUF883 family membrane-anchored ribosome-binding protein
MADTQDLNQDVQKVKEDAVNSFGQLKNDAVRVAQTAAEVARSGVETAKSKLTEGTDAVRAKLADHKETARAKLNDGTEAARDAAYRARDKGNDLLAQLQTQIEENPLQAVAIAAGVGVVVGILMRRR